MKFWTLSIIPNYKMYELEAKSVCILRWKGRTCSGDPTRKN